MTYTVKRVAVIGAGVSGVTSAKHLQAAGVEVVVYERSAKLGGNWLYDERQPLEPTYPSTLPSRADFLLDSEDEQRSLKLHESKGLTSHVENIEKTALQHAPPGPAYSGLTNNASTALQEMKGFPWPPGTADFVNVRVKWEYIQSYAKHFNIEPLIKYHTRVEKLEKLDKKWIVNTSTLINNGVTGPEFKKGVDEFDAVVVASGHYHACKVPDTAGLKDWKAAWPDRVQHSKAYRRPEEYAGQNILLIGGGVSSSDIAREVVGIASKIYQSSRGSPYDVPLAFQHPSVERIGEVISYAPLSPNQKRGSVILKDRTLIHDIDRVILCTGYFFTYPFLLPLHEDSTPPQEASETVLVTDGNQIHNLHNDIFYIRDPTLAFVGVPFYTATFTLFEYQAIAVTAVFSGRAWLPSPEVMREKYNARVEAKGYGRAFHSLRGQQVVYVDELLEWINGQAEVTGAEKVEGHSERWKEEDKLVLEKMRAMYEVKEQWQREEQIAKSEGDNEEVKKIWGKSLEQVAEVTV